MQLLKKGSYGKVYSRGVEAVKITKRNSVSGWWLNEINILTAADHPNIVKGRGARLELDSRKALPVIIHSVTMELGMCDLTSLPEDFPLEGRKRIYADVLRGLEYCHLKVWLIHRDLKPHNIILFPGPDRLHAKIADFGNSMILRSPTEKIPNTEEAVTYPWRAPELWFPFAKASYGTEIDAYSVAVMGLELLYDITPPGFAWHNKSPSKRLDLMAATGFPVSMGLDPDFKRTSTSTFVAVEVDLSPDEEQEVAYYLYLQDAIRARPSLRPTASALLARLEGRVGDEVGGEVVDPGEGDRQAFYRARKAALSRDYSTSLLLKLAIHEDYDGPEPDVHTASSILEGIGYDLCGLKERLV